MIVRPGGMIQIQSISMKSLLRYHEASRSFCTPFPLHSKIHAVMNEWTSRVSLQGLWTETSMVLLSIHIQSKALKTVATTFKCMPSKSITVDVEFKLRSNARCNKTLYTLFLNRFLWYLVFCTLYSDSHLLGKKWHFMSWLVQDTGILIHRRNEYTCNKIRTIVQ